MVDPSQSIACIVVKPGTADILTIAGRDLLPVGQYRALLTDREREILRGDDNVSTNYYNQVRHRVRQKIAELQTDVEILERYEPDLVAALVAVIEEYLVEIEEPAFDD